MCHGNPGWCLQRLGIQDEREALADISNNVLLLQHRCPFMYVQDFYADFARVADDESRHLSWCLQRLGELGHAYGDMVAHNMLWEGAEASSGEPYYLVILLSLPVLHYEGHE